jgi:hypothetical protein
MTVSTALPQKKRKERKAQGSRGSCLSHGRAELELLTWKTSLVFEREVSFCSSVIIPCSAVLFLQ